MSGKITVVGSSNVDMIMQVAKLPALGETVTDGVFLQTFGGKGANQADAAARAGGDVTFLTCLGRDAFGPTVAENFARDGIDTSRIVFDETLPTGAALIMFDNNGDNYLTVAPGSNYALTPEHIDANADILASSAMVVLQLEIEVATILRTLEVCAEKGVPVLLNFAPARTSEIPIDSKINTLVVNEIEAEMLTGVLVSDVTGAKSAAEALLAKGPSTVIVTLGADGALVTTKDGLREVVPAFKVTPVDTTAAGDCFCGALTVALVEGKTLLEAVRFAGAASALSVTRMGAQPSLPTRTEIDRFLAERP